MSSLQKPDYSVYSDVVSPLSVVMKEVVFFSFRQLYRRMDKEVVCAEFITVQISKHFHLKQTYTGHCIDIETLMVKKS